MTFHVLEASTTADSADMNDNYYHVAQGAILPYTQTAKGSLSAVDSTYDLGNSTTTWKTLHTVDVEADSITSSIILWRKLSETAVLTTTSRIEFSGLSGDDDIQYKILLYAIGNTTTTINLYIDGDSTSANYRRNEIAAEGATATAAESSAEARVLTVNSTNPVGFAKIIVEGVSGTLKTHMIHSISEATGTTVTKININKGFYFTTSALSSIQLTGTLGAGSQVELYGRNT